jgi:serine/threonine protein kinase
MGKIALKTTRKSSRQSARKSSRRASQRRSINRRSKQRGGGIVGVGSAGCIVKPSISCPGKKASNEHVSKLVLTANNDDENERVEILGIKKINDYEKYFIVTSDNCVIQKEDEKKMTSDQHTDYKNCRQIMQATASDTFVNSIQLYGGASMDVFRNSKKLHSVREMIPYYNQLFEILRVLQANGIVHRDIKSQNIVINPKEGKLRLIDFGLSHHISEDKNLENPDKIFSQDYPDIYQSGYYIWPAEITLFKYNDSNGEMSNTPRKVTGPFIQNQLANLYSITFSDILNTKKMGINDIADLGNIHKTYLVTLDVVNRKFAKLTTKKDFITTKTKVNSTLDLYSVGITILKDLLDIVDKKSPELPMIKELVTMLINEIMLKQDSGSRMSIDQLQNKFMEICKKYGAFVSPKNSKKSPSQVHTKKVVEHSLDEMDAMLDEVLNEK